MYKLRPVQNCYSICFGIAIILTYSELRFFTVFTRMLMCRAIQYMRATTVSSSPTIPQHFSFVEENLLAKLQELNRYRGVQGTC